MHTCDQFRHDWLVPLSSAATNFHDLTREQLRERTVRWGFSPVHAARLWSYVYLERAAEWALMPDLPVRYRTKAAAELGFPRLPVALETHSADGFTRKYLLALADDRRVETVLMRYTGRVTACISSQAGCAMGCVFCATGQMGFVRHLTPGEIVAQALHVDRVLQAAAAGERLRNIVLMGMGEPLHNYDNTMAAIDRLNDPDGYNFGARRFTLSTVGLIPAIQRFASEKRQVNLAISLHAADDALRASMLPVDKRYPIDELLEACQDYITTTGRRITFEWALVNGINDTSEQAHLLVRKLKGLLCHVNAIPLNPTEGYSGQATTRQRAEMFKIILDDHGVPCTIRLRRGMDIQAGCGQLVSRV